MKKYKIFFWITSIFIFLFEGVMPAFTFQTEMAKEGIRHLGYPDYFGVALVVFKVGGSILLVIPRLNWRVKEWVYAGFGFDFTFAAISYIVLEGVGANVLLPLFLLLILIVSYICYHKVYGIKAEPAH